MHTVEPLVRADVQVVVPMMAGFVRDGGAFEDRSAQSIEVVWCVELNQTKRIRRQRFGAIRLPLTMRSRDATGCGCATEVLRGGLVVRAAIAVAIVTQLLPVWGKSWYKKVY